VSSSASLPAWHLQRDKQRALTFCGTGKSYGHATTIDILTDDILLEIFGFILRLSGHHYFGGYPLWKWHRLVHVCRRWRQIIFSSPLRLDLQLLCTYGTPVWKRLGCWPAFPLAIDYGHIWNEDITPQDEFNIFAALKQRNRVRHIDLSVSDLLMEKLFAVMEEPFSALTHLLLSSKDDWEDHRPVIPSKFLGGSAPLLHEISFFSIPFPTIPAFLSSASDLVKLRLENVSPTSFPSPEALVACLAALTKLEDISIEFQSDLSTTRSNQIRLPPETRVILPALASLSYKGDNAYLDDFVARINTPRLNSIDVKYTEEVLNPQVTELSKLIERSNFQLSQLGFASIFFETRKTTFLLRPQTNPNEFVIAIRIPSWGAVRAQVADMTLMLSQVSTIISHVVRLDIGSESPRELDEVFMDHDMMESEFMDRVGWLELFHPFIAVKTLRISDEFVKSIANEFEERTVETVYQVLPALKSLYLESEPFMRNIAKGLYNTFKASGRPLTVVGVERL
jgi:hypothetical protein